MLLDEDEALHGATLLSMESDPEFAREQKTLAYIQDNFPSFLKYLRELKKEDQELLLSYYILAKTQNTLAVIHRSTQTVCSFRIRMARKVLGAMMLWNGVPDETIMSPILAKAGLEDGLAQEDGTPVALSTVIAMYAKTRSFQKIAEVFKLHRPDIRRAMSRSSKTLMETKDPEQHALGAYIHSLIDKANPSGTGFSKRKVSKLGNIYRTDPDILGEFRIKVDDPEFEHMFVSRANR